MSEPLTDADLAEMRPENVQIDLDALKAMAQSALANWQTSDAEGAVYDAVCDLANAVLVLIAHIARVRTDFPRLLEEVQRLKHESQDREETRQVLQEQLGREQVQGLQERDKLRVEVDAQRREIKEFAEAVLMARGWFEGNPEGALEEVETRARAALGRREAKT